MHRLAGGLRRVIDSGAGMDIRSELPGKHCAQVQIAPTASGVTVALIVIIDVTEQHQREQKLLQHQREQKLLYESTSRR